MLSAGQNTMRALVIYDISGNKLRRDTVKILSDYGNRVQKSAFEMNGVTKKTFSRMMKEIERLDCNKLEDSIRVYMIEETGAYRILGKKDNEEDKRGTVII